MNGHENKAINLIAADNIS